MKSLVQMKKHDAGFLPHQFFTIRFNTLKSITRGHFKALKRYHFKVRHSRTL
jgi:hypothetical protein